jgi:hypothetical protein
MHVTESLKQQFKRIQLFSSNIGGGALALCAYGASISSAQFFQSYLFGYLFWIGIALGSLALLSLHHLVGGGWGFTIQRVLESSTKTLPLMIILFIPFFFGIQELYLWARPEAVAADEILFCDLGDFYFSDEQMVARTRSRRRPGGDSANATIQRAGVGRLCFDGNLRLGRLGHVA